MTTARLLYDLQELDQEVEGVSQRLSAIDDSLGNAEGLRLLEGEVSQKRERLQKLEMEHRDGEMAADSAREKISNVEAKLYGGSVKNPRELQDLDHELKGLKRDLQNLEDRVLESLVTLEQVQEELKKGADALERDEAAWSQDQQRLAQEKDRLLLDLGKLKDQRQQVAQRLGPQELQLYERLWVSKGGQAVARVERGLCRACSMTLATHQLQRARAGREAILCGSCGRILYVG